MRPAKRSILGRAQLGLGAIIVALTASTSVASADILTLRADAKMGAAGGKGMFGAQKDEAFHQGRGKLGYGLVLGAEVFFVDGWIQHDQYLTGGDVSGTWTQFMLGFDVEVDMGAQKGTDTDSEGNKSGGYSTWFAELGMGMGFGVGTGQQVEPPLNNAQLTDKGFLVEARGLVAYRITNLMSLGLSVPVQFGYFTKAGPGTFANDTDQQYSAVGGTAMLNFRVNWNLK